MYLLARSWGIQPTEFWDMTLGEWFAEWRHNRPSGEGQFAGKLTADDIDDLMDWMEDGSGN